MSEYVIAIGMICIVFRSHGTRQQLSTLTPKSNLVAYAALPTPPVRYQSRRLCA